MRAAHDSLRAKLSSETHAGERITASVRFPPTVQTSYNEVPGTIKGVLTPKFDVHFFIDFISA